MTTATMENLWAGDYPRRFEAVTIAASQTITVGTVIGIVTASGQAVELNGASSDGSQNFYGVAVEAVTTGVAETQATVVAISGDFNSQQLSLGGATTIADIKAAARALNCYIHTTYSGENITGA